MKLNNVEVVNLLEKGDVIILPSDTVYGLFADATNIDAIKKVDEIKSSNKPHLIIVSDTEMLSKYVKNMSCLHKKIIDKYWPNTLTILFEKSDLISDELTKGSNLVAVRIPNNKMLIDLVKSFNKPLLSTSCNITNKNVITDISKLDKKIKSKVSYIYDGGKLNDIASTIIRIDNNKIVFLREGILSSIIKSDFKDYL